MGCLRGFVGLVAILLVIGAIGAAMTSRPAPRDYVANPVQRAAATIDKSPQLQAERQAFIQRLIQQGGIQKIETPGNLPRAWVTRTFMSLDFDTKAKLIGVVYAFYFDGSNSSDVVVLIDSVTGKRVGIYSDLGLKLD